MMDKIGNLPSECQRIVEHESMVAAVKRSDWLELTSSVVHVQRIEVRCLDLDRPRTVALVVVRAVDELDSR